MNGTPQPRSTVSRRELAVHGALLLLLVMLLFPAVFLRGEMAVPGTLLFEWPPWSHHAPAEFRRATNDTTVEALSQFTVWYSLTQEALRTGEWPLWNPLEFTGMPLLANWQSAVFYPPHVLNGFLDVYLAMTIYVILKVWLCGITAYLCARVFGLGAPASRFASVAWMLAGFNMIWAYWPLSDVLAWTPVLLLGTELLLQTRYRRGMFAVALGATLMLLAGHPETAFVSSSGVGVYFLLRLVFERRRGASLWRPVAAACGGWALALVVCAVQLAPFLEYLRESHTMVFRATDEGARYFIQPLAAVAFWAPRFFGASADGNFWLQERNSNFVSLAYPGVVVWVGAACLVARRGCGTLRARQAVALAVTCVLFMALAFNVSPVAQISRLPFLSSIRGIYHLSVVGFTLALLGGLGLDHWLSRPRKPAELLGPVFLVLAATTATFGLYWFCQGLLYAQGLEDYVRRQILAAGVLGVGATLLLGLCCLWPARGSRLAALLTALLAADLLLAAQGLHPTCPRKDLFVETELTRFFKNVEGPVRVSVESSPVRAGMLANYGIEELWGYDGIFPKRILGLFGLVQRGAWGAVEPMCAASYYLFAGGSQAGRLVARSSVAQSATPLPGAATGSSMRFEGTIDGIDVCRNLRAFPRAFLMGDVRVVADEENLLDAMCEPGYDPSRVALTEAPPPGPLPKAESRDLGHAFVRARSMTRVTVDAQAHQDCVLVLADAYFPGWRAWIDGNPAPLFPVYYAFRGVVIPAGNHTVEYRYNPASFRFGLAISTVALLASALGSLGRLGRRAKARRG